MQVVTVDLVALWFAQPVCVTACVHQHAAAADDDDDDDDEQWEEAHDDKDVVEVCDSELQVYGRAATLHPHIEVSDLHIYLEPFWFVQENNSGTVVICDNRQQ